MNGFLGEFFGTMVLIVLGCGTSASFNLKKSYGNGTNWLYVCFSWGLAVTMGVYVANFIGSQAHLNPAITISFAIFGKFSWHQVIPYIMAQFLGAFIGASLVALHFYPHFKNSKSELDGNSVGIFATRPAIKNNIFNLLSEIIATFFFALILICLGNFSQGLKPLIIGLVITVIGTSLGTTTGFALNPARDLSPRLAYALLPIPNKSNPEWHYSWIPFIGPIIGAILATGISILI